MPRSDTTRMTFLMRLRDRSDTLTWEQFNERYGELLYCYARKRGASHDDAEDVVQEVIMSLFKAMEGFEYDTRKGRFRGYLRTAVVHAMGRRAQKEAKQAKPLVPNATGGEALSQQIVRARLVLSQQALFAHTFI